MAGMRYHRWSQIPFWAMAFIALLLTAWLVIWRLSIHWLPSAPTIRDLLWPHSAIADHLQSTPLRRNHSTYIPALGLQIAIGVPSFLCPLRFKQMLHGSREVNGGFFVAFATPTARAAPCSSAERGANRSGR
jgi:hypothetical protein